QAQGPQGVRGPQDRVVRERALQLLRRRRLLLGPLRGRLGLGCLLLLLGVDALQGGGRFLVGLLLALGLAPDRLTVAGAGALGLPSLGADAVSVRPAIAAASIHLFRRPAHARQGR